MKGEGNTGIRNKNYGQSMRLGSVMGILNIFLYF